MLGGGQSTWARADHRNPRTVGQLHGATLAPMDNRDMKRVLAGTLSVAAAVTLAGCSSSGGGSPAGGSSGPSSSSAAGGSGSGGNNTIAPTPTGKAPNPVDVLRKTGAEVPAGATSGTDGPNGTRETRGVYFATEADRQSDAGEQIDVTTYPSDAARAESGDVPPNSDDAHWYITFDRGLIVVTGVEDATTSSVQFGLPAETIAQRVNGKLIPRD